MVDQKDNASRDGVDKYIFNASKALCMENIFFNLNFSQTAEYYSYICMCVSDRTHFVVLVNYKCFLIIIFKCLWANCVPFKISSIYKKVSLKDNAFVKNSFFSLFHLAVFRSYNKIHSFFCHQFEIINVNIF